MRKQHLLKTMLLLCALIVGSSSAWADEVVTLWSEDFSSYEANDVPSGGTYSYSCGGSNTKIYEEELAGGKSPELLLQKSSNGTFTATIPLDNIEGELTLTFKTNNQKIKVETTTTGLTGSLEEKASGTHTATFNGVTTSTTSITIKFTCSGSSNVRLDDIVLKGTQKISGPSASLSTISLIFGEVEVDKTSQKTFTVTPANLTSNLTIASNNDKYTVSPTTIAQDASGAQTITVTAAPTAWNDDMKGTITISGGGLTSNKTVTLIASPYQVANVTLSGTGGTFEKDGATITSLTSHVGRKATITAVPNEHYTFTSWAAEGATPASSTDAETEFTLNAATVKLTATFTEDPKYTATFYVLGVEAGTDEDLYEGEAITFPNVTAPTGYTFMGWTATEITATQATAPADLVTSANMGTSDVTYYAVFAKGTETPVAFKRYEKVTSDQTDWSGTYILASTYTGGTDNDKKGTWVYKSPATSLKYGEVEAVGDLTTEKANYEIVITKTTNGYTIYHSNSEKYFAYNGSDNQLNFAGEASSNELWTITISGALEIKNVQYPTRSLKYNGSSPRFACYTSGQTAPDLYKRIEEGGTSYSDYCTTVPPVSVTITSAEYATYCNATYALDFSGTGITAYTATDGETSVKLNKITSGQVPANTPVVLYKAGADGTAINVPVIASADDPEGTNDLRVSEGAAYSNAYVLAMNPTIGFYLWNSSVELNAGKIYLQAASSSRSFLGFEEGNTTSIDVRSKMEDVRGEVYNLNGQRVAQPTKGLYIVNGKKVVVK